MPSNPSVTFNILTPATIAEITPQKVLIVGQLLAGGTAVSGELQKEIGNDGEENGLFGGRSHIAGMIREFKRINQRTQLDAIGLSDDGGAVAATGIFTITGQATEDGTLTFIAHSGAQQSFDVPMTSGDLAVTIGTNLAVLINADVEAPYTANNVGGVVTLTASNGGTVGDKYSIQAARAVAGVAVALTGWTGGANDPPGIGTVFDPVANIRYQTVIYPDSWDITVAKTFIDARFNVANGVQDGVVLVHQHSSVSSLKATVSAINSQSISYRGTQSVNKATLRGGAIVEGDDVLSARVGAVRSLRLTEGAPISDIVATKGSPTDSFGGSHLSTLPYFNTLIANTAIPNAVDVFTDLEEKDLENNGVGTIGRNISGSAVILGQQVTTRLTDNASNPDTTFKFLNAVDSSSVIREFFVINNKSRYAQSRLTDGDLLAGISMANENSIRAFQKSLYVALAAEAITQEGTAAIRDFEESLVVTVDVPTGTVTIDAAPLQVGQLRTILGTITVNFGA